MKLNSHVNYDKVDSTRVDEARESLIVVQTNMEACTAMGKGEKGPLSDPGSGLYYWEGARE